MKLKYLILSLMFIIACKSKDEYRHLVASKDTVVFNYNSWYKFNLPYDLEKWNKFQVMSNDSIPETQYYFFLYRRDEKDTTVWRDTTMKYKYVVNLKRVKNKAGRDSIDERGSRVWLSTIKKYVKDENQ